LLVCKQIVPTNCRYDVLSTKVEIRLAKAEPIQWTSLEFSKENTVPLRVNASGKLIFLFTVTLIKENIFLYSVTYSNVDWESN
jgi:hypothetical protein